MLTSLNSTHQRSYSKNNIPRDLNLDLKDIKLVNSKPILYKTETFVSSWPRNAIHANQIG